MNKYDDIKRFMDKTNLKELDYKELNDKSTGESITGSMNQWTLIKQVSASQTPGGPLDSGRSTQPTPQAISADEFSPSSAQETLNAQHLPPFTDASHTHDEPRSSEGSPPAAGFGLLDALRETLPPAPAHPAPAPAPQPVHSTPSLHAQSVVPDSGSGLLDSLRKAMPETVRQPPVAPAAPAQPATPVSTVPVHSPAPTSRSAPLHTPAPAPVASADSEQRFKQMFKQRAPQPVSAYLHRDTPLQPLLEMIASCR